MLHVFLWSANSFLCQVTLNCYYFSLAQQVNGHLRSLPPSYSVGILDLFLRCFSFWHKIRSISQFPAFMHSYQIFKVGKVLRSDNWLSNLTEIYKYLIYDNLIPSCLLIGSCLWSMGRQMHKWCRYWQHFASLTL